MASLGAPVTTKFSIGTAEVRVGPLRDAGRLTQAHSIGLVDSASVSVEQESVDLEGGFPQVIVDTAVVKQTSTLSATLREYSRRNMKIMLGGGLESGASPVDTASLVVADAVLDATEVSVTVTEGVNFSIGDIVVMYPEGRPEDVCIDRVTAIIGDALTLENGIAVALNGATETVHIYVANPIAIGAATQTNYFSVMMIQKENSTGRPLNFQFWKAAISGSMTYDTNATDFASNDLELKLLQPAPAEYGAGGDLLHLANVIPTHPTGLFAGGAD